MSYKRLVGPSFVAAGLMLAGSAAAQNTPSDLRDMVGARAGQAEGELGRRGYVFVRSQAGDDRRWGYWWNADRRQCVTIATVNGRYDSIVTTPAPDCRQQADGRPDRPDRPDWGNRPDRPDRPDYGRPDRPDDGRPGGPGSERPDSWPGGRPITLGLVCFGEGQKPAAANRWGYQWNWKSGRYDFGNRTELTTQQFDASVMIQLWSGGGRIRLPRSLIPPIHSGGSLRDGWWDMTDVYMDGSQVRATYRLNGMNKPRVTIDRRSGRITIRGAYNYAFRGTCDTIDGPRHQRF